MFSRLQVSKPVPSLARSLSLSLLFFFFFFLSLSLRLSMCRVMLPIVSIQAAAAASEEIRMDMLFNKNSPRTTQTSGRQVFAEFRKVPNWKSGGRGQKRGNLSSRRQNGVALARTLWRWTMRITWPTSQAESLWPAGFPR